MTEFATVGILAKRGDSAVRPTLEQLYAHLGQRGVNILVESSTAESLKPMGLTSAAVTDAQALAAAVDLLVVIGGDGTLLEAGRLVATQEVPLVGINMGRLGFMVDVLPRVMAETLDQILDGVYERDPRMLLNCTLLNAEGEIQGGPFLALNDVVLRNKDLSRVIDFDTRMDDQFISHHRADGMIVATPTGSTAYALSGGGPVIHPGIEALALVPICPHTLSDRPLVVPADGHIELRYGIQNQSEGLLSCDGQVNMPLSPGDRVRVQRADKRLTLLHPSGHDYFGLLRSKLQWGREQTQSN